MKLNKFKNRAFTLIELIIVIILIGILAGMSLPKFIGVQRNAKVATMIRDIDTLEKAIKMYENDNDTLPIYDVGIDGSNLGNSTKDMEDIYTSLKEVLRISQDGEEYLYKVNIGESSKYHSKTKYGHNKTENDFYVYSTKTDRVYYYGYLVNEENTIQHNNIKTTFTLNNVLLEKKKLSKFLKPIKNEIPIAVISGLDGTIDNTTIINLNSNNSYDPDGDVIKKVEWKINNVITDKVTSIKLPLGENIIELRVMDSNGAWSEVVSKLINVKERIITENDFYITYNDKEYDLYSTIKSFTGNDRGPSINTRNIPSGTKFKLILTIAGYGTNLDIPYNPSHLYDEPDDHIKGKVELLITAGSSNLIHFSYNNSWIKIYDIKIETM